MIRELKLNATEHIKFCEAMNSRLRKRDITINDFAKEIGVSPRSIYNFCRDTTRNPSKFLAAKIANALEIKPYEYKSSKGAFFCITLLALSLSVLTVRANAEETEPRRKTIEIKEEYNIYDEVFGVDNGTDFVPGFYEPIVDEDIPISAEDQLTINEMCLRKDICPELVYAIIERESGYQADVINASGKNYGAMQINPNFHKCDNPLDLIENVDAGTTYLQTLFNEYEDVGVVLMTYHGESDALVKYQNGQLSEYAKGILERSEELERAHGK